jgi:hypothetical protein
MNILVQYAYGHLEFSLLIAWSSGIGRMKTTKVFITYCFD